ncbi:MAG: hypothetical protein ACLUTU_18085 [Blautia faecis]
MIGTEAWKDYSVECTLTLESMIVVESLPVFGDFCRYYGMVLQNENELHLIMRNGTQEKVLARCAFEYELDKDYRMKLRVKGDVIKGFVDGVEVIHASDQTLKKVDADSS